MVVKSWTMWILHSLYALVVWMTLSDNAMALGPCCMESVFPALCSYDNVNTIYEFVYVIRNGGCLWCNPMTSSLHYG